MKTLWRRAGAADKFKLSLGLCGGVHQWQPAGLSVVPIYSIYSGQSFINSSLVTEQVKTEPSGKVLAKPPAQLLLVVKQEMHVRSLGMGVSWSPTHAGQSADPSSEARH